jgi:hypothetical protein
VFFKSKITIYLSLGLYKGRSSYRRSLQPLKEETHPALQNMKLVNFFLFLRAMFALLDPDPESGSGSTDLIESGSRSETIYST